MSVTGENCLPLTSEIFKEQLQVVVSQSDVSAAHRGGAKPKTQKPDGRNIIIKLCRRELKRELL